MTTTPSTGTDPAAVVTTVIENLTGTGRTSVLYERVIQRARRNHGMDRSDVESTVERLVERGVVDKRRGEFLQLARDDE